MPTALSRAALGAATMTAVLSSPFAAPSAAAEPLQVVATFSILGDMVQTIGGDRVTVTTLVGPGGDMHVFQPTPRQAASLAGADMVVMNGLGLEGWLERLVEASGYDGPLIEAAHGVTPLPAGGHDDDAHADDAHEEHAHEEHAHEEHAHEEHAHEEHADGDHDREEHAEDTADAHGHDDHAHEEHAEADYHDHANEHGHEHAHDHGAYDPHAWQDLGNAVLYVAEITEALSEADPDGAATFAANAAAYVDAIEALNAEGHATLGALADDRRTVLTNHDAFAYFAGAYGITFVAPQGISTEAEPSARDVAALIRQIRDDGIDAVFLENLADNRLVEQIAAETGATVGGVLYADALSAPGTPGSTYLGMMRHNIEVLAKALGKGV